MSFRELGMLLPDKDNPSSMACAYEVATVRLRIFSIHGIVVNLHNYRRWGRQ